MTTTTPIDIIAPADVGLPAKFPRFRANQFETALQLLASRNRFKLLNAPTGAGKSLILMTLALLHGGRVLYLVGTKSLQRQLNDFKQLATTIYGKANYHCNLLDDGSKCDVGPCNLGDYCTLKRSGCTYYDALNLATGSQIVIDNYAQWFTFARHGNHNAIGEFDLLLCDEAHGLLNWITQFAAVTITKKQLSSLLNVDYDIPREIDATAMTWLAWAGELHTRCRATYVQQRDNGAPRELLLALIQLGRDLRTLSNVKPEYPWICERVTAPSLGLRFTPIWPRYFTEELLFRGIKSVVLSSATLHPILTRYLSIPSLLTDSITTPSPFDPQRRPFYIYPIVRVDNRMTAGDKSLLYNACDNIITARPNDRILVHTHSYARAREFMSRTRHANICVTHTTSRDMDAKLKYFLTAPPPRVFVSPSVAEGHDFAHDAARVQIILKVPFLPPDELTKARRAVDKQYANYVSALTITQQYGRVVRAINDYGETFMVDKHFSDHFYKQQYFPSWFRDARKWITNIPKPLKE